jgi:hypothetical protein
MRNLLRAHSAQLRVQLIAWPRFRAGGRCTVTNSIGRAVTGTRPGKHMHLPVQVLSNVVGDPPATTRPEPLRFRRSRLPPMKAAMAMERTEVVVEVRCETAEEAQ